MINSLERVRAKIDSLLILSFGIFKITEIISRKINVYIALNKDRHTAHTNEFYMSSLS